jgi:hypothetical protein
MTTLYLEGKKVLSSQLSVLGSDLQTGNASLDYLCHCILLFQFQEMELQAGGPEKHGTTEATAGKLGCNQN